MFRILVLLALATCTACSPSPFMQANKLPSSPVVEDTTMPSTRSIAIRNVTLLAREERISPDVIPPQPNPDLGFATVFLRIENAKQENATVKIESIEIRTASDSTLQAFRSSPQEIHLKPLEHSEVTFDLTNKIGYSGQDKVKAVVTYQMEKQVSTIESEPVEVEKLLIAGST